MERIEGRRKFIFGVGAFAAGLFLPVHKLIFPVQNNPLGNESIWRFESHDGYFAQNSTGNKPSYLWMVSEKIPGKGGMRKVMGPDGYCEEMRLRATFRQKFGCPPDHPMDGEVADHPFIESLDVLKRGVMSLGPGKMKDHLMWRYHLSEAERKLLRDNRTAFKEEVFEAFEV